MGEGKIKLVCFDLNKTLIEENTWLDLNLAMGMTKEEDDFLLHLFEEKVISYRLWTKILCQIYKKRGKSFYGDIYRVICRYSYKEGAKEVIEYFKNKGYEVALISGAMNLLVEKVAGELEINYYEANNIFIFDKKDYLKDIIVIGDDELVKVHHLQSFCRKLGISLKECACIGDGDNDRLLFEETGHGVTFKGSRLENSAWKVIKNLEDLKEIF